jgi:hypothetical protein
MNVAGDGMLCTLGTISAQEEFYASQFKSRSCHCARTNAIFRRHGNNADNQVQKLAREREQLMLRMQRCGIEVEDVEWVGRAIRQALLHAVLLLVTVLVADEVDPSHESTVILLVACDPCSVAAQKKGQRFLEY